MASPSSSRYEWGMAWQGRHGQAYGEPVFQYLLALERARSARLGLPLLTLLVELTSPPSRLNAGLAARLFSALTTSARETDIVGWHRHLHVAGLVVTETGDAPLPQVSTLLRARIVTALERCLPDVIAYRVHVQIHAHPRPTASFPAAADVGAGEDECSISA
jgi:hypothetical protein